MTRRVPLSREATETIVDGFTHGGEGVARIEGKAVFVPGTIPGERVVVRVVDDRKRWARAELLEVRDADPARVTPPCPTEAECPGHDLQHIAPDAQRRLKARVVAEQLVRLGGIDDPPVEACRAVGPDLGYRNRARFHAAPDGRLGFHRPGTHEVVPVGRCLLLSEEAQAVRDQVGDGTGAAEVTVRAHASTGTSAAILTPSESGLDLPEGAFDLLLTQPDGSTLTMRGDGRLAEVVAGFSYEFDASAFFQVNTSGAEALVATVLAACGEVAGALTWDLYAGVGLLSVPLARARAEVVAVEGHPAAATDAVRNGEAAGVEIDVVDDDVRAMVGRAAAGDRGFDPPDVVVLDPPRTGAGAEVVGALTRLAPANVIYVACDPAALARDARALVDGGYTLQRAVPLDLFPMTHHVEVVATFTR